MTPAALLLLAVTLAADPPPPDATVAATVNGEVIRLAEVDSAVRREVRPASPLTGEQVRRLRRDVLDELIDDRLLSAYLKEHAPPVEVGELDQHLRALDAALRRQGRSLDLYYRETGRSPAQVREAWANLLKFQKFVDARAADADLRKYHEANRDLFDRVTVCLHQIVVRVPADAIPGEWLAARRKLAGVKADLMANRLDFPTAARRYSEDAIAAAGGEVGWVTRRDLRAEEPVLRMAFSLSIGETSDPVDGPNGVYLVRVSGRKPGKARPFEEVAALVRECFADDVRRELVSRLREKAAIQISLP